MPDEPTPSLGKLTAASLAQLSLGFYFLFWGLMVLVATLAESLVVLTLRPLSQMLIGAAGLAIANGAWRLHRITDLGPLWRTRTRFLLLATVTVAYLSFFYIVWRQLPGNFYFLIHALLFFGLLLLTLCLLCLPVITLAKLANRPGLALQAGGFGTAAVVLLVPPYTLIAIRMLDAAHRGIDPFSLLQFWLEHIDLWIAMILLVPFSLTLSLLWSAKDLVLEQLNSCEPPP